MFECYFSVLGSHLGECYFHWDLKAMAGKAFRSPFGALFRRGVKGSGRRPYFIVSVFEVRQD